VAQLVERQASNRKVANPWFRLPMRLRVAVSLRKTLNAVSDFGAKQSTRYGGPTWRKTCK